MSEPAGNEAATFAAERAVGIQARLAGQAPQPDGAVAPQPEAGSQAAQAAAEFRALVAKLEAENSDFGDSDLKEMRKLYATPGILELLGDVNPKYLDLLDIAGTGAESAGKKPTKAKTTDVAPAAPSARAPKPAEAQHTAPAAAAAVERTVASAPRHTSPENPAATSAQAATAETENSTSPFEQMSRKDFTRRLVETITADQSNNIFVGLKIDVTHSRWLQTAYELRTDPTQMQAEIAELITNALGIRKALRTRGVDSSAVESENRVIAARIAERFADLEQNPEHLRGIAALVDNIKTAPGKGIRRALAGLRGYYNRSVDARVAMMGGRNSAESSELEPEEEEREYSQDELARFEQFTDHVRKPRVRKHIAAQLKALEAQNAMPDVRGGSAATATAAEALTPAEATRRQAILEQIAEARAILRDLRVPDAEFPDEDEINPEELIHLLELLDALQVSIDPRKKGAKTVGDFMPDAPTPEEPEAEAEAEEEPTTEAKVGFWQRLKLWNRDKKEARHHVEKVLDFDYVDQQLKAKAKELHPKNPNFNKIRNKLNKAAGLLAQVRLAADKDNALQRDPRDVKQLREMLISLGIAESAQAEQAAADDAEAEGAAAEAVNKAELSQGKKNWLKKKLKETGDFLRSPAFLLGVAAGAATDLLLHTMGADPQNKAWIKTIVAALVQDSSETQYLKAQALQIGAAGGMVGMASMGWFRLHDRATQMVGKNVLKFMVGFGGGAIGMHLGHTAFENSNLSGLVVEHPPVVGADADEQLPAAALESDAEPPILGDGQSEANPHAALIKPDSGVSVDDLDAPPAAKAPTIEPDATAAKEPAVAEPGAAAAVASEAAQEFNKGTQKWTSALSEWWKGMVAAQEQGAKKQEAQAAIPVTPPATPASESKNPFFMELDKERAGVDITANVHDGSSIASNAEADTPAPAAQVVVSGENAHETADATVVAAAPVVEQQLPAVEVVKFDSEHIWAEAAQITGGDNNRTDFLKDVGRMFDETVGKHEHKMGDSVIVIADSVHTAADLQKLHDLHPEAAGFTLPDESLKKLDAFYQEALNTEPAQRNALQQDVIKHFTGGMSGADLAKNPQAVEAMLKIAHGETVDGSQHIIGDATEQVGSAVESSNQPTQQTAREILDAAVQEHNLELKHPLVGQGIIDHLMHELPDNKIEHPELIATFVDGIWDKWVEGCHKLNLDPMQASPKIVDYIKDPSYNGTDPLSVSPVRATIIDYIQHGNSMHGFTMERGDGQTINLNLDMAHSVLTKVDDNPSIGQLMANNGVDSAIGQINIEEVFGNNAEAYYKQVQNKQTP